MPPIPSPAKVLVTGASGFLTVWVVKALLDQGYTVVGTVRSKPKGEYLEQLFSREGYEVGRFTFLIVGDIGKEGAFDNVVVGFDAVVHTASPVNLEADDPQDLIVPAVKGTVGILQSIKNHAPTVGRVVITSSVATILSGKVLPPGEPLVLDETDRNTISLTEVEEKGRAAAGVHKYRASKILAERAAWAFVEENRGSIAFDLVTILPPMVYGPIMHQVPTTDALNASIAAFRKGISLPEKSEKELLAPAYHVGYWVDVRDVAAIHALSLANPAAGGERFVTCSGPDSWQNFVDAINNVYPDQTDVVKGYPGKGRDVQSPIKILSYKAEKAFNFKFRTYDDTAPATYQALRDKDLWT